MVTFRRILIFLSLFSVCFAQHSRKCADVPIKGSDGKTIRVSQYQGKVVMFVLFSTSCDHCMIMLQLASSMQKEMASHLLQVVAVVIDDNDKNVKPFADRYRFPFPVGYLAKDPTIQLADLKKDAHPAVPVVIFVDWMGNVRFQYDRKDPIFDQGEKGIRGIATGLCRQAESKTGPVFQTAPAAK
jgi:peroxiredoxin